MANIYTQFYSVFEHNKFFNNNMLRLVSKPLNNRAMI